MYLLRHCQVFRRHADRHDTSARSSSVVKIGSNFSIASTLVACGS
jgi:hypothetical protein